jgi:hypothetical protein
VTQPPSPGPYGPPPAAPPPGYRAGTAYAVPPGAYSAPPNFQPAPQPGTMTWAAPGYPVAPQARPAVKHSSHTKVILILVGALALAVGAFVLVSALITPGPPKTPDCPPDCPHPPTGKPISAPHVFTAANGSFSVSYLASNQYINASTTSDSVLMKITPPNSTEQDEILLAGNAANGQSAEQVVNALAGKVAPDAKVAYVIPNATVGFQKGYGLMLDNYQQSTSGGTEHDRIAIVAAVKNDTALIAVGVGPYREFSATGLNDGHPSGADSLPSLFMDDMINSFTWKGDPPR